VLAGIVADLARHPEPHEVGAGPRTAAEERRALGMAGVDGARLRDPVPIGFGDLLASFPFIAIMAWLSLLPCWIWMSSFSSKC
jgi:hypothetical protein